MRKRLPVGWLAAAMVFVAVVAVALLRANAPYTDFAAGKMIRFDDFDFTALSAQEVNPGEYEVVVEVKNSARRVDFEFDPSVVRAFGPDGKQLTLEATPAGGSLHVGESLDRVYRFKGTVELRELLIRFSFGGSVGSFADSVLFGNRQVRVQVVH